MTGPDASPAGDAEQGAAPEEVVATPPSLRERLRPLELLGISGALAAFAGLITLFVVHPWGAFAEQAAHNWLIVLVVTGAAFVLSLVVTAMLALGGYEPPPAPDERGVLAPPRDPEPPEKV